MNFEVIDNFIQAGAMGVSAVAALILSLLHRDRRCMMLAFAYACFSMGTLYYVLMIAITGEIPRVFYVSEVSWIAAYTFFLSIQMDRTRQLPRRIFWGSCLAAAWGTGTILFAQMMGPSPVTSGLFAVAAGGILYLTVYRLRFAKSGRLVDILFLVEMILQVGVYISSYFTKDYTGFNLYFLLDLSVTFCSFLLLPSIRRENPGEAGIYGKHAGGGDV